MMSASAITDVPCTIAGFFGLPGQMEFVILLVIVLLLFGNRLPGAMRNLGQSFVQFKKGIKDNNDDSDSNEGETKSPSSTSSSTSSTV